MSFTLGPCAPLRWFVPAQNGVGLVPADGYFFKFFESGLGTGFPKTVYTDASGNPFPIPSNTVELNSEGYAVAYFGSGVYAAQITDPDGAQIAFIDPYIGAGGGGGVGFSALESIYDQDDSEINLLAEIDTAQNKIVYCAGYFAPGDGGAGYFYSVDSSTPEDGGYCFASTFDTNKRWFRVPDESGIVRAAAFGYIPTRAEVLTTKLQSADAYAASIDATLLIEAGNEALIDDDITFAAPVVQAATGARYNINENGLSVTFQCVFKGQRELFFSDPTTVVVFSTFQVNDSPEQFGASLTSGNAADNTDALNRWIAAGGGAYVLPPGTWLTDGSFTGSSAQPIIFLGETTTEFKTGAYFPDDSKFRLGTVEFANGPTLTSTSSKIIDDEDLEVQGDLTVGGVVTGTLTVEDEVITDLVTAIDVTSQAGTSSKRFKVGGRIFNYTNTTGIATSGTGETDLVSTTIEADMLEADGDSLEIHGGGTGSTSGNTIVLKYYLGTNAVLSMTCRGNSSTRWFSKATITKHGTDLVMAVGWWTLNTLTDASAANVIASDQSGNVAVTLTGANTLKMTGTCNAGSITQKSMFVDYVPAPI